MNCPRCNFPAKPTDTFCEKCGVVFAEYNLILSKERQKQEIVSEQQERQQIVQQQHQLQSKYLCNSEGCSLVESPASFQPVQANVANQAVSGVIPVEQNLSDHIQASDKVVNDFNSWGTKVLVVITIIAAIFFLYFFVII